jgi:DNA polymerase III alpha subunit
MGCTGFLELKNGRVRVAGVVSAVKPLKTKKDGQKFASFTLVDKDEVTLQAVCFPDKYTIYGELINEGNVLIISGQCGDNDNFDGTTAKQVAAWEITLAQPGGETVCITASDIKDEAEIILPALRRHKTEFGLGFVIFDETFSTFDRGNFLVSREVFGENDLKNRICYM